MENRYQHHFQQLFKACNIIFSHKTMLTNFILIFFNMASLFYSFCTFPKTTALDRYGHITEKFRSTTSMILTQSIN